MRESIVCLTYWGVPHTVLGQVVPVVEPIGGGIAESVELVGVGRQADPSALGVPPERARNPRGLAYRTAAPTPPPRDPAATWACLPLTALVLS